MGMEWRNIWSYRKLCLSLIHISDFNEQQTVILVNPGDYEELVYTRNKWNVKIKGAGMTDTKVHYANNEVFNPHPLTVKTNEWPGTFPSRRACLLYTSWFWSRIRDRK